MTKTTGREPHQVVEVPAIASQGGGSDIEGRLSSIESQMQHLATKAELAELRGDMKEGFAELRSEIKDTRIWVLGGVLGGGLAGLSAFMYLMTYLFDKWLAVYQLSQL